MAIDDTSRTYKDGIFRSLFNDEDKLLELYNAVSGSNYPKGTPIQIVTLENAIFNGLKNDLAFIIDKKFIVLTEQQSTLSPNYPLRMICYLAEEYKKLAYSKIIYSKVLVEIPTPEMYVFYNGKEDAPEDWELKLSDAFAEKCDKISVEAVVKVINVNYEKGAKLLEDCRTMKEYSLFVHKVNQRMAECADIHTAVTETIRECIEKDILADYLMKQRGNIMSVLEVNLSAEEREEIRYQDGLIIGRAEGLAEGLAEGKAEGKAEEKQAVARKLKAMGLSVEQIKEATGLDEEEIEKL